MNYEIDFSPLANSHIEFYKKTGNISILKKIDRLLDELREHPTTGTGKPEKLKDNLSGKWSRRINRKDRLVYTIDEDNAVVNVLSARGHYEF